MLDFGLAGVGVIFFLAMVTLYENSCTFVLRIESDRNAQQEKTSHTQTITTLN